MKVPKLLFLAAAALAAVNTIAQTPFSTKDSVDINNITALTLVHGDMWWDPQLQVAACQFPAHSGKNINFAGALWMSGYDGAGQLHVAAQTYRQDGNDYWPGPLDSSDTLTYANSYAWAKIWKVNRTDIQSFLGLSTHTTTNTPNAILTWPGKGNTHAQGNGGTALTVTTDMAPFVDLNGNGVYEPLLGEYPDIRGDQALWWVFSDNGPTHTQSLGKALGVEIHNMAYAYHRGTLVDNVIYYDYSIYNRSSNNYHNFRIAQWDDMDLGFSSDDYIGFDSSWRLGITYNGTNDDGGIAGHPVNSYGHLMPIAGITMVVLPGDAGTSYVPAGAFTTYNNDFSVRGNPTRDTQFNYYMRGQIRDGSHFTNTFGGAGNPCLSSGSGPSTNYMYTGDPSDPSQWSECNCHNTPGDRRFIISSNDFTLNAGAVQHVVMALVTTNLDSNNGCPAASFTNIKIVADTAWNDYYNPPPPLPAGIARLGRNDGISIYPNPAHDKLFIDATGNRTGEETILIFNTLGQQLPVNVSWSGRKAEASIGSLPQGMYYVLYRSDGQQVTAKFVKN